MLGQTRPSNDVLPKCHPRCEPPCSHKGSNAFVRKETCNKCGNTTTTKFERKPPSVAAVAACQHSDIHHSGSTRTIARAFCTDCRSYVGEEPQTDATRAAAKAPAPRLPGYPSGQSPAPSPPLCNSVVHTEQLMLVANIFRGLIRTTIQKAGGPTVTQRQPEKLPEDAIDIVAGESDGGAGGSAPRSSGQAAGFMHTVNTSKSSGYDSDGNIGGPTPGGQRLDHPDLEKQPILASLLFLTKDAMHRATASHGSGTL